MNFKTLSLFCSVAERRSFSRAAEDHCVSQGAVSQAMQHLEQSLGVQLIDRSRRPLMLTSAGNTFLTGARDLLRRFQTLEENVRNDGRQPTGQLVIGAINSAGITYLPDARDEFSRRFPDVKIRLEFGSSEHISALTNSGHVDFGIVSFSRNTTHLQSVKWLDEPMRVVCSPAHALAENRTIRVKELNGIPMVCFDRDLRLRTEIDECLASYDVSVDAEMEFDNTDSMIRAIQANRGIGILPEAAVRREITAESLRLIQCPDFEMTRPVGIIIRRGGHVSHAAREFVALLLGKSPDDLSLGDLDASTDGRSVEIASGAKSNRNAGPISRTIRDERQSHSNNPAVTCEVTRHTKTIPNEI
ncbi:MAG: LysR family transcriptional regulator [Planctomycetota bacterium]